MLESFTVGAVFTVKDESQTVLAGLERRIANLDVLAKAARTSLGEMSGIRFTGLSNSLGGLERRMTGIADRSAAFRVTMAESMAGATTSINAATESARGLAAALTEAAAAGRAVGRANLTGAEEGAVANRVRAGSMFGGGRGHLALTEKAGPLHARIAAGPVLAGAAALGYGAYEEAGVQDVAARLMYTAGRPIDTDITKTDDFKRIRDTIQSTTSFGYKPSEVGDAMLSSTRMLSDSAKSDGKKLDFSGMMDLEKMLMPMAVTESILKPGTSLEESLKAFVALPHMAGQFDPAQIQEMARQFAFVSTRTEVGLPQFTRALSYSLPVLHGELGMDAGSVMADTAAMQRAGITNTKSGTWLREFMLRGFSGSGRLTNKAQEDQDKARKELGLVDSKGKSTFLLDHQGKPTQFVKGQEQNIDWQASMLRESQLLEAAAAKHTPVDMAQLERKVFGAQGGGLAALEGVPAFVLQLQSLMDTMKDFKPGEKMIGQFMENSPLQKGKATVGDFKNVLMDIGTDVLPILVPLLRGFDDGLKALIGTLHGSGFRTVARAGAGGAAAGAAVGAFLGGPPGAVIGAGIGGTLAGGAVAARMMDDNAKTQAPHGSKLDLWSLLFGDGDNAGKQHGFKDPFQRFLDGSDKGMPPPISPVSPLDLGKSLKVPDAALPPAIPPAGTDSKKLDNKQSSNSIVIQNLTVQVKKDDPQAYQDAVIDGLVKGLAKAAPHNLGTGDGSFASPYTG